MGTLIPDLLERFCSIEGFVRNWMSRSRSIVSSLDCVRAAYAAAAAAAISGSVSVRVGRTVGTGLPLENLGRIWMFEGFEWGMFWLVEAGLTEDVNEGRLFRSLNEPLFCGPSGNQSRDLNNFEVISKPGGGDNASSPAHQPKRFILESTSELLPNSEWNIDDIHNYNTK